MKQKKKEEKMSKEKMKIYVIKKDSFVNVLDDNYKIKRSEQFSRDVQFDERWLYDTTKCECCDKKLYIFHHKKVPFISTDAKNVSIGLNEFAFSSAFM